MAKNCKKKTIVKTGYMDKVDHDHELSHTDVKIYPSIADLILDKRCVGECGIVRVTVRVEEVILDTDLECNQDEQKARLRQFIQDIP